MYKKTATILCLSFSFLYGSQESDCSRSSDLAQNKKVEGRAWNKGFESQIDLSNTEAKYVCNIIMDKFYQRFAQIDKILDKIDKKIDNVSDEVRMICGQVCEMEKAVYENSRELESIRGEMMIKNDECKKNFVLVPNLAMQTISDTCQKLGSSSDIEWSKEYEDFNNHVAQLEGGNNGNY